MFEDIKNILNNYQPTNNEEQDKQVKEILSRCFQTIYKLERDNGELVEKILKIEKVEGTLLYEIEKIKNQTGEFLGSWTRYNW
jgi:hypothetical protein